MTSGKNVFTVTPVFRFATGNFEDGYDSTYGDTITCDSQDVVDAILARASVDLADGWHYEVHEYAPDHEVTPGVTEIREVVTYTLQSGHYNGTPTTFDEVNTDTVPDYAWPGGYTCSYVTTGGDVLCGACVRKELTERTDDAAHGRICGPMQAESSEHTTGLMCDGCSEWIIEPQCADCARTFDHEHIDPAPFTDDSGSVLVCATCLAKEVQRGNATKTGKREYAFNRGERPWYAVNHPAVFTR